MKRVILFFALIVAGMVVVNAQPPTVPADAGATFGQKTTSENAITVEELFTLMKAKDANKETPVKLQGVVTEVCKMEGCWIKIQSPGGSMMVKMKDHKFLVPVILNGKTIVIDGVADEKLTSVEQLRHFADDAGKSKAEIAKITEPKREILIQAKGILVL